MKSSARPARDAGRATGAGRSYALLADGTTMTIRPATPGDYQAVRRLHEAMSPDNLYFRFFSASQVSAEREARRVCLEDRPGLATLLGLRGDDLVGVASYELTDDPAAASPRCCSSTWSRWPGGAACGSWSPTCCRTTTRCCTCSPTRA